MKVLEKDVVCRHGRHKGQFDVEKLNAKCPMVCQSFCLLLNGAGVLCFWRYKMGGDGVLRVMGGQVMINWVRAS